MNLNEIETIDLNWSNLNKVKIDFIEIKKHCQQIKASGGIIDSRLNILYEEIKKLEQLIEFNSSNSELLSITRENIKTNTNNIVEKMKTQTTEYEELNYFISYRLKTMINNLFNELDNKTNLVYNNPDLNNQNKIITEEMVKKEIQEKFAFNKNLTNDFTRIVFDGVKDKVLDMINGEEHL